MTQFTPPMPPDQAVVPAQGGYIDPSGPPKWSALAIAAFICSLLICLPLLHAILGLVLGVAGIMATSNGARRGRGLAIAAIPISVVTGFFSTLLGLAALAGMALSPAWGEVRAALEGNTDDLTKTAAVVLTFCTDDFKEDVDTEQLASWFKSLTNEHGKLINVQRSRQGSGKTKTGGIAMAFSGKFVNGPCLIRVVFVSEGLTKLRIADIEVDGQSVRGSPELPND